MQMIVNYSCAKTNYWVCYKHGHGIRLGPQSKVQVMDTLAEVQAACIALHTSEKAVNKCIDHYGDADCELIKARDDALKAFCVSVAVHARALWLYPTVTTATVEKLIEHAEPMPAHGEYNVFAWGVFVGWLLDEAFKTAHE